LRRERAPCHLMVMGTFPRYFRKLHRILRRRGRTREEAEDLIQQAFLKLQEYCERGGQVRQPEGFLLRTVLRLAINARRDQHRELYVDANLEELTQLVDTRPTPEEVLAHDECLERMTRALGSVGRRTRNIFLMHRLGGMSYLAIAQHLGVTVSAIEKHVASALAVLAEANSQE
jgi:RNA polymerase sigma factor (sigma-70 family)